LQEVETDLSCELGSKTASHERAQIKIVFSTTGPGKREDNVFNENNCTENEPQILLSVELLNPAEARVFAF
jgi:hypothetical protein